MCVAVSFYPRDTMRGAIYSVAWCLSVCPSVTVRHCVKTAEHIVEILSRLLLVRSLLGDVNVIPTSVSLWTLPSIYLCPVLLLELLELDCYTDNNLQPTTVQCFAFLYLPPSNPTPAFSSHAFVSPPISMVQLSSTVNLQSYRSC